MVIEMTSRRRGALVVCLVMLATTVACGDGLGPGEERHRLLTHCGLSFPMRYEGKNWLPTDPELRQTFNAPRGFSTDGYWDEGSVRSVDEDTLIYTSSGGTEVEYEPTKRERGGCE
jgi:hypothetical protein